MNKIIIFFMTVGISMCSVSAGAQQITRYETYSPEKIIDEYVMLQMDAAGYIIDDMRNNWMQLDALIPTEEQAASQADTFYTVVDGNLAFLGDLKEYVSLQLRVYNNRLRSDSLFIHHLYLSSKQVNKHVKDPFPVLAFLDDEVRIFANVVSARIDISLLYFNQLKSEYANRKIISALNGMSNDKNQNTELFTRSFITQLRKLNEFYEEMIKKTAVSILKNNKEYHEPHH
ncbi:hypothetical protein ACFL6I_14380 [candidate division KSB1 bacterium]